MSRQTITVTATHYEILEAVARLESGSWEVFRLDDVKDCVEKGWVELSGKRYRLTEAGREVLKRRNNAGSSGRARVIRHNASCAV